MAIDQMGMADMTAGNIFTDRAESIRPSVFSFTDAEIADVLKYGSNSSHSRERIINQFERQKSIPEIAAMLRNEFHGGFGIRGNGGEYSAWHAADGIRLARGRRARESAKAQVIPWDEAAGRIRTMLDNGTFASNVELAEADGFVRSELALHMLYLYHDLSAAAREMGLFPSLSDLPAGYPDATAALAGSMSDTAFAARLQGEYRQFMAALGGDRSLLRFHYHRLDGLRQGLDGLTLPRREYFSDMVRMPEIASFITEDEIDELLAGGSHVEGGRGRIYGYFSGSHNTREKADFLEAEYGIGGHSHAISGSDSSSVGYDYRGIRLAKANCPEVRMSWTAAAERITKLIRQDRFLTPEEKQRYEEIRAQKENDAALEDGILEPVAETSPDVESQDSSKPTVESPETSEPAAELPEASEASEYPETSEPDNNSLTESIALINEYTQREFGQDADYSDPEHVDIAFTTSEQDDIPIQVSADLIHHRMRYEAGGREVAVTEFEDIGEFHAFLGSLDFSEQVSFAEEQAEKLKSAESQRQDKPEEQQEQTETRENQRQPNPIEPAEPEAREHQPGQAGKGFSYGVGDTVYLGGSAFEIEQIGSFNVHLRDLSSAYPISRAMNRQGFEAELQKDERNASYLPIGAQDIAESNNPLAESGPDATPTPKHTSEPKMSAETVGIYTGEKNRLPFDVEIRKIRFDEPEREAPKETMQEIQHGTPQEPTAEPANGTGPDTDVIPHQDPDSERIDGGWRTFPDAETANNALNEAESEGLQQAQNFRILDDHLGEGGPKEKFWRNVKAIVTLKQIESEHRQTTPEEQLILSQCYSTHYLP